MPPYFEEAALLLQRMVRMGLMLPPGQDARAVLFMISSKIQWYLLTKMRDTRAANDLLSGLKIAHGVTYPQAAEQRLVALIGTSFSNLRRAA